jgi:hypothetical protein
MNFPPAFQHLDLLPGNDPHGFTDVAHFHPIGGDQFGRAAFPKKVDLCCAIAKNMDMRRFMVIGEYDEAKPAFAVDRDHSA